MPFDPNKPYTVIYEPPAPEPTQSTGVKTFDPNKPFTVISNPGQFDPNKEYSKINQDGSREVVDPQYEEFKLDYLRNQNKGLLQKAEDFGKGAVRGALEMAGLAKDAIGEAVMHPIQTAQRIGPTLIEGAAQGTAGLANIGGMLGARAGEIYQNMGASDEEKIRNAYIRSKQAPLIEYGPDKPLVPVIGKEAMPAQAEALGMVLDPITLASMGAGALPEAGIKASARKYLSSAGQSVGRGMEKTGMAAQAAWDAPNKLLTTGLKKLGYEGAESDAVKGVLLAGSAFHGGLPAYLAGTKGAGVVAETTGRGLKEFSTIAKEGPSQLTILERIAKNPDASPQIRKAAGLMSRNPGILKFWGMAANAGKGAAVGAGLGTGMGILSGQDAEGVGEMAGGGAALGLGGYALGKLRTAAARNNEAKAFDRVRFINEQAEKGNDVSGLRPKVLDKMVEARLIFGDQVDIQVVDNAKYAELHGPGARGGAYFQASDNPNLPDSLVVQRDVAFKPEVFLEEVGHGIYAADPTNRAQIQDTLRAVYGDDYINEFEKNYARQFLASEGNRNPTPADIDQKVILNRQEMGEDLRFNELFARDFVNTSLDQSLLKLRNAGKLPEQGSDPMIKSKMAINLKGSFLKKVFGIEPENITSAKAIPASVDPAIRNLIVSYIKDVDRYKRGLDRLPVADKYEGATVMPAKLVEHPAFRRSYSLDPVTGRYQNDFSYLVMKDGSALPANLTIDQVDDLIQKKIVKFQPRPLEEIRNLENRRLQDAVVVLSRNRSARDPVLGRKSDFNDPTKTAVRGEKLPEEFWGLETFSPSTKMFAKAIEENIPTGNTFSVWYQRAGTGAEDASWAKSVKKGLGNIRAAQYEVKPISFSVSKVGNLLTTVEDVGMRNRVFEQWFKEGRLKKLWGDDFAQFNADYDQWVKNHSLGHPGEDLISNGLQKKNVFRAITGSYNKANPLENVPEISDSFKKKDLKGFYKTFRVDRIQGLTPTGSTNNHINYGLRIKNYSPNRDSLGIKSNQ